MNTVSNFKAGDKVYFFEPFWNIEEDFEDYNTIPTVVVKVGKKKVKIGDDTLLAKWVFPDKIILQKDLL